MFLHYYNLNRQIVRFKNMLKATFRQVAILPPKNELYTTDDRDAWLNRLRTRLTMKKVIDEELKDRTSISPEDISEYYKKNYQGKELDSDATQSSEDMNEAIVKQLRREKAEQAYKTWIEELKAKYAIEINSEQWDKITAPRKPNDNEADSGKSESD